MAQEIEHKYLVINTDYREMATSSVRIRQGYLTRRPEGVVRIRIKGDRGYLTVKGKNGGTPVAVAGTQVVAAANPADTSGATCAVDTRLEFEYEIPVADTEAMLCLCEPPVLDKTRYLVPFGGYTWEVDEFHTPVKAPSPYFPNLVIAEVELATSHHDYPLPPFIGPEVTTDPRYYNSAL